MIPYVGVILEAAGAPHASQILRPKYQRPWHLVGTSPASNLVRALTWLAPTLKQATAPVLVPPAIGTSSHNRYSSFDPRYSCGLSPAILPRRLCCLFLDGMAYNRRVFVYCQRGKPSARFYLCAGGCSRTATKKPSRKVRVVRNSPVTMSLTRRSHLLRRHRVLPGWRRRSIAQAIPHSPRREA